MREVVTMLTEHDWVYVVQCAADRDEKAAKKFGPEFYQAYKNMVKQMEEDKKNGVKGTYSIPTSYD